MERNNDLNSLVLSDASFVSANAEHVRIDNDSIRQFADSHDEESLSIPAWEEAYHYRGSDEDTVAYLLVLSAMNFASGQLAAWKYQLNGEQLDGYFAVSSALKVAMERGVPLASASYLKGLSIKELASLFSGEGSLPFFSDRLAFLNEMGYVLLTKFDGKAINLLAAAEGSAQRLVSLVVNNFSSFVDTAIYKEKHISFHKRAQIFVGDLYGTFGGKRLGFFHDIESVTAFADDSLPYTLERLGILRYSNSLSEKIADQISLEPGSEEEVEIRACSIVAVEAIKDLLLEKKIRRNSIEIDWILWNLSYEFPAGYRHKTVSTAY